MEFQNAGKGEQYNLRWNNYTTNLIQVFSEHQHHETLVDVTLTCEGQFIKAHKLILSACSGFFQDMFKMHSGIQHPFIILNGIKFSHLKHILEFIYHGEIKILDTDLEGVLTLGENFQVKGLSSVKLKQQVNDTCSLDCPNRSEDAYNEGNIMEETIIPHKQSHRRHHRYKKSKRDSIVSESINSRTDLDEEVGSEERRSNYSRNSERNNSKRDMETKRKRPKTPELPLIMSKDPSDTSSTDNSVDGDRNPRPANAFMIFANEWRKKLAVEHPKENNKEISIRLGNMWKALSCETKESYYIAAMKAQKTHSRCPEYPCNSRKSPKRKTTVTLSMEDNNVESDDDLQVIEIDDQPLSIPGTPCVPCNRRRT